LGRRGATGSDSTRHRHPVDFLVWSRVHCVVGSRVDSDAAVAREVVDADKSETMSNRGWLQWSAREEEHEPPQRRRCYESPPGRVCLSAPSTWQGIPPHCTYS